MASIFGEKLKKQRSLAGLSGSRLAMLTGVPQGTLSGVERGERPPSPANLAALAAVSELGVSLEELQAWADLDRIGEEGFRRIITHLPALLGPGPEATDEEVTEHVHALAGGGRFDKRLDYAMAAIEQVKMPDEQRRPLEQLVYNLALFDSLLETIKEEAVNAEGLDHPLIELIVRAGEASINALFIATHQLPQAMAGDQPANVAQDPPARPYVVPASLLEAAAAGETAHPHEAITGPGVRQLSAVEAKLVDELAVAYEQFGSDLRENDMGPGAPIWHLEKDERLRRLKLRVSELRAAMKKAQERGAK